MKRSDIPAFSIGLAVGGYVFWIGRMIIGHVFSAGGFLIFVTGVLLYILSVKEKKVTA